MKMIIRLATLLVVGMLVLAACTRPDTTAPEVAIITPADGTQVTVGDIVNVTGTAADAGGVASVAVLVDGSQLNSVVPDVEGNWSLAWTTDDVGHHTLAAKATDKAGNSATSNTVTVTVTEVPATTGAISGIITRTPPTLESPSLTPSSALEPAAVVPGELFVVFKTGARDTALGAHGSRPSRALAFSSDGSFSFAGNSFAKVAAYPSAAGLELYRTSGLDQGATRDLIERLNASDLVAEAFPNWVLSTHAAPDDPYYELQWHYPLMNLPAAWEMETGESNKITVAVLDTGRFDHPDVQWADAGASFVYDPLAGDFDPDEGPIDNPYTREEGSPHGTHVAGTIGAASNNGEGVAGVNWNVDVVPVKVLGRDGSGGLPGIIAGALWAAGVDDPMFEGYVNDNPARVLNMSLGGLIFAACPASIDSIFANLASAGTYVVASAGNDGTAADTSFPANCPHVITVGATGPTGARAYYSNFGPFIDVMAPGGDDDYDAPGLPFAGVLSTVSDGTTPDYGLMMGTSMAAPHVSGVVSLMLAQDPTLSFEQVRQRLHDASQPLTFAECAVPTFGFGGLNLCGAGLLDAEAAILGNVLTTPTAYAYALPYAGDAPPTINYGDLPSLGSLAHYRVEATALENGDFSYSLEDLTPGTYEVIGLELRSTSTGVSTIDRIGKVPDVEVVAGEETDETIVVAPIYLELPVDDQP